MNSQEITRRTFIKGGVATVIAASFGSLLTACSNQRQPAPSGSSDSGETAAAGAVDSSGSAAVANTGKALVVYYSASGNTGRVAETIVNHVGADTFVIEPKEPYTDEDLDWTDEESRVNAEHEDESKRHIELVQIEIPDLDTYDTIFFGYPTWWRQASWVVDDVATGNDFTGKTVIPFTTSTSSPLGDSGENLAKLAGTGNWLEGMRFSESTPESDVVEWVDGLNL